jgi:NADH:ubiquinone oxidoreductase subunit 4 (subunit M)
MTRWEIGIAAPLVAFAILLGVYPPALLNYTDPTINKMADDLAGWTKRAETRGMETQRQQP